MSETAALAASAAQSMGGIMGNITNAWIQSNTNKKNQQFTERMYDRQRQDALADWQMQAQYNSPEQQMRRYKEAGLNPNLIYGQGASATNAQPVRSVSPQSYKAEAPQIDTRFIGDAVNSYFNVQNAQQDLVFKQQQTDNLKKQSELLDQQKLLMGNKIIESFVKGETGKFDLDFKKSTRHLDYTNKELTNLLKTDNHNLLVQNLNQKKEMFKYDLKYKEMATKKIYSDMIQDTMKGMRETTMFPTLLDLNKARVSMTKALEMLTNKKITYQNEKNIGEVSESQKKFVQKQILDQQLRILKGTYSQEDTYWLDKIFKLPIFK